MTKYVCTVCGYIAEGTIPEFCPVCKAPASKFIEKKDNTYVTEHVVGIAKDVPEEIKQGLRENFNGECSEVGMYLAMSRVADREGYPEIAEAWKRYMTFVDKAGTATFAELVESAGLKVPYHAGCIKEIGESISRWLEEHELG